MEMTKRLIKIDRNGTKYWDVTDICPRCGGRGDYIRGINYGTCFLCGGSGKQNYIFKEYTPEHEAKLEERRQEKAAKKAEERAKYEKEHADEIEAEKRRIIEETYTEFGCSKDGIGYVLTGKTYPVKDQIKKNGGKWVYGVWVCPVEIKGNGISAKQISLNGHVGSGSERWLNGFDIYEAIHG